MLPCLPNLEILYLCGPFKRRRQGSGNLTDKSCKLISRCRQLRKLDIGCQRKITVAGVKRVLKGCQQLRVFDTSIELLAKDYITLLRMAPQFMLTFTIDTFYDEETYIHIIEETNGQFVLDYLYESYGIQEFDVEKLSDDTYVQYKNRKDLLMQYMAETERYITLKSNKSIWGKKEEDWESIGYNN